MAQELQFNIAEEIPANINDTPRTDGPVTFYLNKTTGQFNVRIAGVNHVVVAGATPVTPD